MKRGYLKRRTKDPRIRLKNKADALLQDYYRQIWGNKKCEGCGNKMGLVHHYVLKSHSNRLRYEEKNLIPVCSFCHSKLHGFHGELITAQIIQNRGKKWLADLRKLEQQRISLTISFLRDKIKQYEMSSLRKEV